MVQSHDYEPNSVESLEKSGRIDTSQLAVITRALCSVCFVENTPLQRFLIFLYVTLAILACANLNKGVKLYVPCAKLGKGKL